MTTTVFDSLPDELAAALAVAPELGAFGRLRYLIDAGSTNDVALSLAAAGEPEGTAVLAETQHAGRGRRGRDWFSPPGAGLYLSIIVRPPLAPGALAIVTLASGVAVADAVAAATGLPVELKWPNDIVIGRPWRKLGGLLCEVASTGAHVEGVVVGIGLNVLQAAYPREIAHRAAAMESELGRPVDRIRLVVHVLRSVQTMMEHLRRGDTGAVRRRWRAYGGAGLHGARVTWPDGSGIRRGHAIDIADDGALLVRTDGVTERLIAGEVTWESWTA